MILAPRAHRAAAAVHVTGRPCRGARATSSCECLEKSPGRRPSSALELWRQLGEVPLDEPWTPERAERWWRENLPDLAGAAPSDEPSGELSLDPID